MKLSSLLFILVLCAGMASAQPRWSPEVRAQKETKWMHDTLHLTDQQASKYNGISLTYHQQMDKVADSAGRNKSRVQQQLMNKKDGEVKALLKSNTLNKRYLKHEKELRKQASRVYTGPHQPY